MPLKNYALFCFFVNSAAVAAFASEPFQLHVERLSEGKSIETHYALCKPTTDGKSVPGKNLRPRIRWSGSPEGTKSFAVIMHDTEVPQDFTNAGVAGTVIAADAPRQNFYHWGIVNIPADVNEIPGSHQRRDVHIGTPLTNDLGAYMKDPKTYGGPCPPWNDARVHRYHFTLYALDVEALDIPADATAKTIATQLESGTHVVSKTRVSGTYTLNQRLRKQH